MKTAKRIARLILPRLILALVFGIFIYLLWEIPKFDKWDTPVEIILYSSGGILSVIGIAIAILGVIAGIDFYEEFF